MSTARRLLGFGITAAGAALTVRNLTDWLRWSGT